jgi:uncharacterized FlgJ-related protein
MKHLKQFRPKLYREMKKAGELEKFALSAQESAKDMFETLVRRGVDPHDAQIRAERTYILLPDEKEVPDLANNPYETG